MSDFFKQLGSILDEGINAMGEGFSALGSSTHEVFAAAQVKREIATLQAEKDALLRDMGAQAWAAHKEGVSLDDAFAAFNQQIADIDARIDELKAKQDAHWKKAAEPFTQPPKAEGEEACACECECECECDDDAEEACECECECECDDDECAEEACACEGKKGDVHVGEFFEKVAKAFAEGVVTAGQKVGTAGGAAVAAVQASAERASLEAQRKMALAWMGERVLELYHQGVELDPSLACKCAEIVEIDRQMGEKKENVEQQWRSVKDAFCPPVECASQGEAECCTEEACECEEACDCGEAKAECADAPQAEEAPAQDAPAEEAPPQE